MKHNFKKLIKIILLPIVIPLSFIFWFLIVITKGKELSNLDIYLFTDSLFKEFKQSIFKSLHIYSNPKIVVSTDTPSINNKVKIGEFRTDKIAEYDPRSLHSKTIDEGVNDNANITLFVTNIYKDNLQNNFLTKMCIIQSLVHQLTHYRQYIINSESTSNLKFDRQRARKREKEAIHNSKRFVINHFITIMIFLVTN